MYKGHVTSGVTSEVVSMLKVTGTNPFWMLPTENKDAVWVETGPCMYGGVYAESSEFPTAASV